MRRSGRAGVVGAGDGGQTVRMAVSGEDWMGALHRSALSLGVLPLGDPT